MTTISITVIVRAQCPSVDLDFININKERRRIHILFTLLYFILIKRLAAKSQ